METRLLTPVLSVAAQISVADLAPVTQAGFKSIICNRPDGESADQTGFEEIAQAAHAPGLQARYLPAEAGKVSDKQDAAFGQPVEELPRPVLAYCRSGMRSTTMWALSSAGKLALPGITGTADRAGYGCCPLTVECGKIVLTELICDGKLVLGFPKWLIDSTRAWALAWRLKKRILPPLYWDAMLKGREWMVSSEMVN